MRGLQKTMGTYALGLGTSRTSGLTFGKVGKQNCLGGVGSQVTLRSVADEFSSTLGGM